jgi:hypothetical protein
MKFMAPGDERAQREALEPRELTDPEPMDDSIGG